MAIRRQIVRVKPAIESDQAAGIAVSLKELGGQYGARASAILIDSAEGERSASPTFGTPDAGKRADELFRVAVRQSESH